MTHWESQDGPATFIHPPLWQILWLNSTALIPPHKYSESHWAGPSSFNGLATQSDGACFVLWTRETPLVCRGHNRLPLLALRKGITVF